MFDIASAPASPDRTAPDTGPDFGPDSGPANARHREPISTWALATLIAAPLLMVVGSTIHPAESADGATQMGIVSDHATRWAVAHDLLALGAIVMVGAVLVLGRLLHAAAPRTARIGTALGVLGCGGLVGVFAMEGFGAHALLGLDRASAGTALELLGEETMASFAPVSLALTVGLIILGVGLVRSRVVPVWAAAALVAGAAGLMIGVVTEVGLLAAAGQIVMAAAMVGIAERVHCGPQR